MPVFSKLYTRVIRLAGHRHAPVYLAALSFAESSFFPVPPDVMLAPMAIARRERAWSYALLTTVASVLGGIAGYGIGLLAFEFVAPFLDKGGYWPAYRQAQAWFAAWGFWAVLLAGVSPIPYKIFTITAGVVNLSFPAFVLASLIGRGARFFLVTGLIVWGGERMDRALRTHADAIGWTLVALALILYLLWQGLNWD